MKYAKYAIQISVMAGDAALICAMAYLIHNYPEEPLIWIMSALTIWVWSGQGGFMAWNPKVIKNFLRNAKKIGL